MTTSARQPDHLHLALTSSLLLFAAVACTPSATPGGESSETSGESTGTETETGTDTDSDVGELARGLRITEVLVNQGVAVAVADGGAWVDAPSRNARLIAGRPSLVQVRFDGDPATESRDIEVWLMLEHPELELEPLVLSATASPGTSVEVDFELDPALGQTDVDVVFRVELRELVGAPTAAGEVDVAVSPSEGAAAVGFEPLELVPEVVLVPMSNPGEPPPTIDAEPFRQHLMAWMPATRLELSVHAPIEVEFDNMIAAGFPVITMLRDQEQPEPDVAYIGVVHDPAGAFDYESLGNSFVDPDPQDDRVGMLAIVGDELVDSERLAFLLYIQHAMRHVDCPDAEPFDSDPNYPYAEGKIGVWGWDMSTDRLFDPAETYDLASWCDPRWISDYNWSKALESLRITSSW